MNNPSEVTLLEQYKLAVEMADRISQRRQQANTFFVSVVSVLTVANSSQLITEWHWTWAVTSAVALVCWLWWRLLGTYRALNDAKFKVIHEMEKALPFAAFALEQQHYQSSKQHHYVPLSRTEQWVPILFASLSVGIAALVTLTRVFC